MKKNNTEQMLRYIKKSFFTAIRFFSSNVLHVNSLTCVSMNNQECKLRPEIIKLNATKAVVIQSMIHMLKYVFLTTLKIQMSKYLI